MVIAALNRGSNVNSRGGKNNETCLIASMKRKDTSLASLLLDQAALDVNATDDLSWTALHYAVYDETASFVKLLLTNPALNKETKNNHGQTPLMLAVLRGKKMCVEALLDVPGIDLDTKDLKGRPIKTFARQMPSIWILFLEAMDKREESVTVEEGRKRAKLEENQGDKKKRKDNRLDARRAKLWAELKRFRLKQNKIQKAEKVKSKETEEEMAKEGREERARAVREFKVKMSALVKENQEEMARMDQQLQERQERLTKENQEKLINLEKRQLVLESEMVTTLLGQDSIDEEEEVEEDVAQAGHLPPPAPDCPICYEPMAPPARIFQCGAGHLVCGSCRPKIEVFNGFRLKLVHCT